MTAMNLPTFLSVVRASRLVPEDRLVQLVRDLEGEKPGEPLDGQAVAKRMKELDLITDWQEQKLLQGVHKGFFLGKYKLLRHVGRGGMGSVFLGEHVLMRRPAAIKVLPKTRVEDRSYLDRFLLEARAVASLDHPNIVKAYNVGNEDQTYYLVMEYVDGKDLERLVLEQGVLGYHEAADYIRQAAEGLHHAHQRRMIHRDIKPGNLLLDKDGTIKVLDMGLAKLTGEDRSLTKEFNEKVLGTTDYLAPEQAIDSSKVDFRADIYSLGCTLYFLLTGHPPFPKGSVAQRLMKHQVEEPAPIAADRPDVPPALVAICSKMMAKRAEDRYQSAAENSEALIAYLASAGVQVVSRLGPAARLRAGEAGRLPAEGSSVGTAVRTGVAAPGEGPPPDDESSSNWTNKTMVGGPSPASTVGVGAAPPVTEPLPNPDSSMSLLATDSSSVVMQKKKSKGKKPPQPAAPPPLPWYLQPWVLVTAAAVLLVIGGSALVAISMNRKTPAAGGGGAGLDFGTSDGRRKSLKPGDVLVRKTEGFPMGQKYMIATTDLPAGRYECKLIVRRLTEQSILACWIDDAPPVLYEVPFGTKSTSTQVPLGTRKLPAAPVIGCTAVGATRSSNQFVRYGPWCWSGPYPAERGVDDLDDVFPPETEPFDLHANFKGKGKNPTADVCWNVVELANAQIHGQLQDILPEREKLIVYFRRSLQALRDTEVTWYFGRDDAMKVFLNGEEIAREPGGTGVRRDHFERKVKLKKGANEVLLKIAQGSGGMGFYFADEPSPPGNEARPRAGEVELPDFAVELKYLGE